MAPDIITLSSDPASSPLSSTPLSSNRDASVDDEPSLQRSPSPRQYVYREVTSLPFEIRESCQIYFEESLYTQALQILFSVLTSGATPPSSLPAMIAPPNFLSLFATLSVYPVFTSRAKNIERATIASLSLRYLRVVLSTVGPTQGSLCQAFQFSPNSLPARNGRKSRHRTSELHLDADGNLQIENELAQEASLSHQAEDVWHVIGWAFNCSLLHKKRWEVWKAWLEFMLDMLETDWQLRSAEGRESLEQSMVAAFVTSGGARRILRAIFANGDGTSASEFREIWPNETKLLREDRSPTRPEKKINIDANNYGDYMENENEADLIDSHSASIAAESTAPETLQVDGADELGGMDSLCLRLRLMSLLSKASSRTPRSFISTGSLYDLFLDHIQALPAITFYTIMSPSSLRHFDIAAASSLTQYILLTIISPNAPQPRNDNLTQRSLEKYYLPFAANASGTNDNAKVSVCVETLLRFLEREGELIGTPGLLEAAEKGIKARDTKARERKRKSTAMSESERVFKQTWLDQSAMRIRVVVKMAMDRAETEDVDIS